MYIYNIKPIAGPPVCDGGGVPHHAAAADDRGGRGACHTCVQDIEQPIVCVHLSEWFYGGLSASFILLLF